MPPRILQAMERADAFVITRQPGNGRFTVTIQCLKCGVSASRPLAKLNMAPNVVAKWFGRQGWAFTKRHAQVTCAECIKKSSPQPAQEDYEASMRPPEGKRRPQEDSEAFDEVKAADTPPVGAKVELITPKRATALLDANTRNRPLRARHIAGLAEDIMEGRWRLNGETIKIARDGTILDGQHRLWAIIEADTDVLSYIVEGLSGDVFDTIDQGVRRSPGDSLAISGEKNTNMLAAACGVLYHAFKGRALSYRSGVVPVRSFLAEHPDLRESVAAISAFNPNRVFSSKGLCAALHYLLGRVDPDARDAFFEKLVRGVELSATSPIYHLRERLMLRGTQHGGKDQKTTVLALVARTWDLWRADKEVTRLTPSRAPELEQMAEFLKKCGLG